MVSDNEKIAVFTRDNWHCRYCQKPVFFGLALQLLEKWNPKHAYHHEHGKSGEMLEIFRSGLASVDHVVPVTAGGKDNLGNLVTACWGCNNSLGNKKSEEGKPPPKEIVKSNWDGFYGIYLKLLPITDD